MEKTYTAEEVRRLVEDELAKQRASLDGTLRMCRDDGVDHLQRGVNNAVKMIKHPEQIAMEIPHAALPGAVHMAGISSLMLLLEHLEARENAQAPVPAQLSNN